MKARIAVAAVCLVIGVQSTARADPSPLWPGPTTAIVEKVIDGDTVDVLTVAGIRERIRILGVDTPELHDPQCREELARAVAARDAVAELVRVQPVRLEDIRALRDRYGRTLARVHTSGGASVSAVMIRTGLGRPYGDGEKRRGWCG